jgi:hypothetical protein
MGKDWYGMLRMPHEYVANITVLVLFVFVILVLSLFNGVFHHVPRNYSSTVVHVVDVDGQVEPISRQHTIGRTYDRSGYRSDSAV